MDDGAHRRPHLSEAKIDILGVLHKKTRPGAHGLSLAAGGGLKFNHGANRIAITLRSPQCKRDAQTERAQSILDHPDLWGSPVLENYIQPAVVVEIGERKGTAVV